MESVKRIITELLQKMNISFDVIEIGTAFDGGSLLSIKTKEEDLLLGPAGEHFLALSHIVKKIATKVLGDDVKFSFDVNEYQAHNTQKLKEKALVYAERVRSFKVAVPMDPMSSYERMIVHSLFAESVDIQTESIGVGSERHVVIRYKEGSLF